jgi:hypothetical protein
LGEIEERDRDQRYRETELTIKIPSKLPHYTIKNYYFRMWSGAHGSTHNSGARGPGFDPTPKTQEGIYLDALISLLSDNRLKNNVIL